MTDGNGKGKILTISSETEFIKSVEKVLKPRFQVLFASTEEEGLTKARLERPDAIVLGYLEPRGSSFRLHNRLRSGWITKHIPLVVVDLHIKSSPHRTWTRDEALQMDAEEYITISADGTQSISRAIESAGLIDAIGSRLKSKANLLKEAILDPEIFCVTWEQIPGRGAFEIQQETVIENVNHAAKGGMVHAISVTDNPGGNPALSTEMLCAQIKKTNMEPLVHLASRDKNRNEIESMLYGLAAEGVRNILVLTGDYPSKDAFEGMPKPVFDIDPVNVLRLVKIMNRGLEHQVMGKSITLAPTEFFAGVCVSPFKKLEAEVMTQYAKLKKKIVAGADFIITQVGYDIRKVHELLQWLKLKGFDVPVLANIYILPYGVAKAMNANRIPGCVVTDKLVQDIALEREEKDKGKSARLLRAAKQYAMARGIGCSGAHIGGHGITYEMVEYIVKKGDELSRNWRDLIMEFQYPQENGFYFFEEDDVKGLNRETPSPRIEKMPVPISYRFSRLAHVIMFNEKIWYFKLVQRFLNFIDRKPKLKKIFGYLEHLAKTALFGCMNCGDCALFDAAYLCPMTQCPKQQRNGPCGGSYGGWCEVFPGERKCIWVRAYHRLKAFGEEGKIEEHIVPPCNWALFETPSWLNFYLGRDHTAKRLGIKAP